MVLASSSISVNQVSKIELVLSKEYVDESTMNVHLVSVCALNITHTLRKFKTVYY